MSKSFSGILSIKVKQSVLSIFIYQHLISFILGLTCGLLGVPIYAFSFIAYLRNKIQTYKLCRGFQQAMEARKTCFISFLKLLFSVLTKGKTVYEARTVNSHNSKTVKPHCHVIFVFYSATKTDL